MKEATTEDMYCLFAPDGTWQPSTLSPDFPTCIAFIKLLHKAKMGKSFFELTQKGFKVLPVRVTMQVTGDENTAFRSV